MMGLLQRSKANQNGAIGTALVLLGLAALIVGPIIGSMAVKRGGFQASSQAIFPHEISLGGWDFGYNKNTNTLVVNGQLCFNTTLSSGRENLNLQATGPFMRGASSVASGTHTAGIGQYLCPGNPWYFSVAAPMTDSYRQAGCPQTTFTIRLNSNRRGSLDGYAVAVPHPGGCSPSAVTPTPTVTSGPTATPIPSSTPSLTPTPSSTPTPTPTPLSCPWPRPGQGANYPPDCIFKDVPEIKNLLQPNFPGDDVFSVDSSYRFHFPWKKPPILDTISQLPANVRSRIPSAGSAVREYRWTIYMRKSDGTIVNCYQDAKGFARRAGSSSTGVNSSVEGPLPEVCQELGSEFRGSVRVIYNVPGVRQEDEKFFDCCRVDEKFTSWVKGPEPTPTPQISQCVTAIPVNRGQSGQPEPNVEAFARIPDSDYKLVCRRLSGSEMEISNYGKIPIPKIAFHFYRCACPGTNTSELKCSSGSFNDCRSYDEYNRTGEVTAPALLPGQRVKIIFKPESSCEVTEMNFHGLRPPRAGEENREQIIDCYTPDGQKWDAGAAFMIDSSCQQGAQSACVARDKIPDFRVLPPLGTGDRFDLNAPCNQVDAQGSREWCAGTDQCQTGWFNFQHSWCSNNRCCSPPGLRTGSFSEGSAQIYDLTCDGKVSGEDISLALSSYGSELVTCDGRTIILRASFFSGLLSQYLAE